MIVTAANHSEASAIFRKLKDELPTLKGRTTFSLGEVTIKVRGKDGIGGLVEEWFGTWAERNRFKIVNPKVTSSSQEFPDYFLGETRDGYLEIKTFDMNAAPNFDIANFESYCESLAANPWRLFSDYLIFGYKISAESEIQITGLWLKKIWEITCPSAAYPLKTQTKRNVIYNIRPASFHSMSMRGAKFSPFNSARLFVNALYDTQENYNGITENRERFNQVCYSNNIDINNLRQF